MALVALEPLPSAAGFDSLCSTPTEQASEANPGTKTGSLNWNSPNRDLMHNKLHCFVINWPDIQP